MITAKKAARRYRHVKQVHKAGVMGMDQAFLHYDACNSAHAGQIFDSREGLGLPAIRP